MKFIALAGFAMVPKLKRLSGVKLSKGHSLPPLDEDGEEITHARHVHKGQFLEVGPDDVREWDKLAPEDQEWTGKLILAGKLGNAADEDLVGKVKEDVVAEAKAREKQKKLAIEAGGGKAIAQLLDLLKGLKPEGAK